MNKTFSIDTITLDKINKKFDKAILQGQQLFHAVMTHAAEIMYQKAVALAPYATGELKKSLKMWYEDYGNVFIIYLQANCPYAYFNEFGWSGIPPVPEPPDTAYYKSGYRPFMRIGMLEAKVYINETMKKAFRHLNIFEEKLGDFLSAYINEQRR